MALNLDTLSFLKQSFPLADTCALLEIGHVSLKFSDFSLSNLIFLHFDHLSLFGSLKSWSILLFQRFYHLSLFGSLNLGRFNADCLFRIMKSFVWIIRLFNFAGGLLWVYDNKSSKIWSEICWEGSLVWWTYWISKLYSFPILLTIFSMLISKGSKSSRHPYILKSFKERSQ